MPCTVTIVTTIFVDKRLWKTKHLLACEQAPGGASAEQTFGAKRRAIGACTHSPKSPLPPCGDYLVTCQISSNHRMPEVKTQNQQTKYVTLESLVWAPRFAEKLQKSYVWLKSRRSKARTITVDVAGCL